LETWGKADSLLLPKKRTSKQKTLRRTEERKKQVKKECKRCQKKRQTPSKKVKEKRPGE